MQLKLNTTVYKRQEIEFKSDSVNNDVWRDIKRASTDYKYISEVTDTRSKEKKEKNYRECSEIANQY